ncbi:MAG: efflux RND transporter periplasmic adaptor subunit [Bacteroidales bacterium]|nr:efflux RND transporter periplasmic adaptor subunit [Bacteroidales bacterium]
MKKILIIATIIVGLISYSCVNRQQTTDNVHNHQHSESCSHNHDHDHDHSTHNHDHSAHSHEHSATCNHDHDHSAHSSQPAAHSHDHNHEGGITFGLDQQAKIDFEVVEVVSEPLSQVIRTSAQIVPSQESEKILTATTSGIVNFEDKDIVQGQDVKAGQVLFSIDNDNMADGSLAVRRQEIEAEYQKAKADYERKQSLAEDKIISQSELLDAKTEYLKAEKHYQNMIQNYPEGKTLHKASISGSIKDILVSNNSYVEAGQPIMTLAQNDRLYIRADVQSKYYPVLKNIKTANIKTANDGKVYSLNDLSGRLLSYGKTTDVSNPLIPITFEVKNNGILIPGSFVEIFITVESEQMGIMLPNTAIVEEMGIYCVFVQTCTDSFEKRIVTKGVTDGNNTQILKGIEAGERVVSKGAVNVKLAQGSAALDPHAGHVH